MKNEHVKKRGCKEIKIKQLRRKGGDSVGIAPKLEKRRRKELILYLIVGFKGTSTTNPFLPLF